METEDTVVINDFVDVKSLCRICLTKSKQMIDLYSSQKLGGKISLVYHVLCKVMSTNVSYYLN